VILSIVYRFLWKLRPICIALDKNESENTLPVNICQDVEAILNVLIDDLWSLAEESQFIEFRRIIQGTASQSMVISSLLN
jgi:hypothetical protein